MVAFCLALSTLQLKTVIFEKEGAWLSFPCSIDCSPCWKEFSSKQDVQYSTDIFGKMILRCGDDLIGIMTTLIPNDREGRELRRQNSELLALVLKNKRTFPELKLRGMTFKFYYYRIPFDKWNNQPAKLRGRVRYYALADTIVGDKAITISYSSFDFDHLIRIRSIAQTFKFIEEKNLRKRR